MLTDEERIRFADYLERDAESNEGLAGVIERSGMPEMVRGMLIKHKRTLAEAQRIVAKELRNAESFSVVGK